MTSNPESWSQREVCKWLSSKGFSHLVPVLVERHKLDGLGLISLTQNECIHILGLNVLGDVKRLLHAINIGLKAGQNNLNHNGTSNGAEIYVPNGGPSIETSADFTTDSTNYCPNCTSSSSTSSNNGGLTTTNLTNFAINAAPERRKALLAFIYVLIVSWMTAFVMVIVHDRVPDMNKYPPLPDILLDNIPHIPWAFEMCEVTGMVLLALWCAVILFHRHRFILMRRFFSISGTIFLLRCVTMLITSLSVPGKHLDCAPRPYGDIWNKYYNAYQIWSGAGLTTQGVRTCGDYMFSGHTVGLTLLNFFITEYTTTKIYFLHTFTWICNVFGIFFILAAHEHYSIDVFVAFYISSRLFMYYHTLANNRAYNRESKDEENRTWLWFPLFFYFETGIDGKIPNEFEWPLTVEEIRSWIITVKCFLAKHIKKPEEIKDAIPPPPKKIKENNNKYVLKRRKLKMNSD